MTRILLAIALILVVWFLVQKRKSRPEPADAGRADQKKIVAEKATPYHAVSIQPGPQACASANELRGRKFLSNEAPHLPLPDCTSGSCECRFTHHADRRGRSDRRSELPRGFGGGATGMADADRRDRDDRRSDGLDDL